MRARATLKEGVVRGRRRGLQGRSRMCARMRVRAKNQQQHVRTGVRGGSRMLMSCSVSLKRVSIHSRNNTWRSSGNASGAPLA